MNCKYIFLLLLIMASLAGCAASHSTDYRYVPVSEVPDGPGLLSGPSGEFVLFRK